MNLSGQTSILLLVWLVGVLVHSREVTDEDKETIQKGIEAGQSLSKALQTKSLTDSLKTMTAMIGPWVDGIGIFSTVLGFFLPEDTELLDTIKQGFAEINERLDAIKEGLDEVKEAIDWAVVKVNFQAIEQDIRLLDEKLKETMRAPNVEHGKEEFIRVYEHDYNQAGLLLWDSIVNNDQVFYDNIVMAGMEYTEYDRRQMDEFMKGLIALMLKSSNIEVSYEKFKEHDRGMTLIWKERLEETQEALDAANTNIHTKWIDRFPAEVDQISKDLNGASHAEFRDAVYAFVTTKYYWLHWFVLAYDDVSGHNNHAYHYYTTNFHKQFHHYGRNFYVAARYSDDPTLDKDQAQAAIKNYDCADSSSYCRDASAMVIINESPWHGVGKVVIKSNHAWAVTGAGLRIAYGRMTLIKGIWYANHYMFYFG